MPLLLPQPHCLKPQFKGDISPATPEPLSAPQDQSPEAERSPALRPAYLTSVRASCLDPLDLGLELKICDHCHHTNWEHQLVWDWQIRHEAMPFTF